VSELFYDLQAEGGTARVLKDLRGFWKFCSTCLLNSHGLPSLQGVFILQQYPGIKDDIQNFLNCISSTTTLVRHDKFPEAPPYPRGGFLVGKKLLPEILEYFFSLNRILALYEPMDPLLNGHNLNLLFENEHEIKVEVVGPGFDMSDIKRGDLSPHETFLVQLSDDGEIIKTKLLQRVNEMAYVESVKERKIKIQEKLYSAPEPNLAHKIREDLGISDDLEEHLKEIGSPLYNSRIYKPISEAILRDTIKKIVESNIINAYASLTAAKFPFVFSTSFVNKGQRQVFWDIVSPTLKYQGLR
jgi:hypothetical protein